ncbi:MAG: hypothetical protein E6J23_05945 [Chloroflexi bacterium]|nr:MAG: hypothetical protein E6J23_05945 [Chloroflexota bacterium]
MRRALAILALAMTGVALLAGSAGAATSVTAKAQLRGHLPELGERPTMRVFITQDAYDTYRNSLGDANVFPSASSLFMTFDKEILALYTRGNDTGGRCIGTQIAASFSGDTLSATASWQAGTCGAPSTAHYPFVLLSLSRTATDGTAWLSSARSVCLSVETQDTNACATLGGASAAPTSTTPPPTATSSPVASTPTPQASATRSLTPTQTAAAASPTAAPSSAAPSATRSPAAAASPPAAASDNGSNILLYAMLVAIGFLVLLSLFLSRGGRRRR